MEERAPSLREVSRRTSVTHFSALKSMESACGSYRGIRTTSDERRVTCKKCSQMIARMSR